MSNTVFPGAIDAPVDPIASNPLNAPSHAAQHSLENDAIVALETKVGINSSADTTSVDYKLSTIPASDKAASKTGTETLTNKTLGTGAGITLGADATGDMYYRNSGGSLSRIPVGSAGNILGNSGGLPAFIPNPAATNGSTSAVGVYQEATTAQINSGTQVGSTGADLVVNPAALAASNYVQIQNIPNIPIKFGGTGADGALTISSGTTTLAMSAAVNFVKNYTSISITGTGQLAFSSSATNGTFIVLRSQGAVALTSSASPNIDGSGGGGAGGAGGASGTSVGSNGTPGANFFLTELAGVGATTATGASATSSVGSQLYQLTGFYARLIRLFTGSGGGGGCAQTAAGGAGGAGGASLLIECAGALNLTATIAASTAGKVGVAGSGPSSGNGGGGGGGGTGGSLVILYNTLTANSGGISVTGGIGGVGGNPTSGTGGTGGTGGNGTSGSGQGGAGGNATTGSTGGGGSGAGSDSGMSNGGTGGNSSNSTGIGGGGGGGGASGYGLVAQNVWFA